jgi:hypothetical protein
MSSFQTKTAEISHRRNYRLYGMSNKKKSLHMFILVLIFQQLVHIYFLKNFSDDGYIYKNDNY